MDHHGHVDVVEMALGDELGLAEHEFDVASGDAGGALLDIDELLGRHRKKIISPPRCRAIPASVSPIAAPSIPAICALWPQLCAAPVAGSASGCSDVRRLSSSPMTARRGPVAEPTSRPLTPVSARPLRGASPRARMCSATRAAVFTSLKPVSGWRRIVSPRSMIVSARRSIASQIARFNSSLLLIGCQLAGSRWLLISGVLGLDATMPALALLGTRMNRVERY